MKKGTGLSIFPGIAIGQLVLFSEHLEAADVSAGTPAEEARKFRDALGLAREQLEKLLQTAGKEAADILEIQLLLLEDTDFREAALLGIHRGLSAFEAAEEAGEIFARELDGLEDPYMRARSADIRDMAHRVCRVLRREKELRIPAGSFVLAAQALSPSRLLALPRDKLIGFLICQGSLCDHTAIVARMRSLPGLIVPDFSPEQLSDCHILAIDGLTGTWYADPDPEILDMLRQKQRELEAAAEALESCRGKAIFHASGERVFLWANIASPDDAEAALQAGAEGIGLLRSELLYLTRNTPPEEAFLFASYKNAAEILGQMPLTIRTLDLGSDKQAPWLCPEPEENPALGLRGLRLCLEQKSLFRTQLRAIYRASVYGNLRILLPMVASLWELREAKAICAAVRQELAREQIPTKEIPIGVMIETPAAAIEAAALAQEADFFSVGTNDLTQYTLASDRHDPRLKKYYDPRHPAVLALLKHIAKAAGSAGIPTGICGELAGEADMQPLLVEMGYRCLSMAPGQIPVSRKRILEAFHLSDK